MLINITMALFEPHVQYLNAPFDVQEELRVVKKKAQADTEQDKKGMQVSVCS